MSYMNHVRRAVLIVINWWVQDAEDQHIFWLGRYSLLLLDLLCPVRSSVVHWDCPFDWPSANCLLQFNLSKLLYLLPWEIGPVFPQFRLDGCGDLRIASSDPFAYPWSKPINPIVHHKIPESLSYLGHYTASLENGCLQSSWRFLCFGYLASSSLWSIPYLITEIVFANSDAKNYRLCLFVSEIFQNLPPVQWAIVPYCRLVSLCRAILISICLYQVIGLIFDFGLLN